MAQIKKIFFSILSFVLIVGLGYLVITNYSLIFSKSIKGEVISIKSVELPVALMTRTRDTLNAEVFSFAIAIKDQNTGEIYTAKSEDRQWAVVAPGQCAEAVFLPYPPWDLRKRGTYFGARLIGLKECEKTPSVQNTQGVVEGQTSDSLNPGNSGAAVGVEVKSNSESGESHSGAGGGLKSEKSPTE